MPSFSAVYPRWLRIGLLIEFLLPSLVCAIAALDLVAPLAPLAGPFAARLYGHSCGIDALLPAAAAALLVTGVACVVLAVRVRRPLALVPLALLWWPAWLFTAFVSVVNASE
ncbi:MAG: hypothetical protein ACI8QS_002004 [Planctomycetota bacterium]|jgi:hypothetical protein